MATASVFMSVTATLKVILFESWVTSLDPSRLMSSFCVTVAFLVLSPVGDLT